jgi:uncharacterized membrane protein (UPF0127 family)
LYDPNDHVLDYMKSSEWKAGMPDGHKEDIPRSYKYQRGGIYGRMYESRGGESELHIYDFDETIARVETPIPYTVESPDGKIIEKGETTSVDFEKTKDHLKDSHGESIKINWDFKAFTNLISKGTLNNEVFQKLTKSISNPNAKVTILTARAIGLPVTKFLKDQGIWAYVVPLGLNKEKGQPVTGEDKANWIENRIKDTTKKVLFIDDSSENRKAIYTLRDKYPSIEFDVENPLKINENHTTSTVLINDIPVNLETMNTPNQQMKGMMGRNSLEGGMLFPYDQVQRRDFHMQDCKMSLDIIFINQGKIDSIHNDCPPCKQNNCPNYSGLADNVLEFPGGYCKKNNVNVGDEVNLNINPNIPNLNEIKYGSQYLLAQYKEEIQAKYGHQQYRNLQTLMSQSKDEEVNNWLKIKGYMNEHTITFTKDDMAKLHKDGKLVKADEDGKEHNYVFDELDEEYCPICVAEMKLEEKKGKCKPSKGKRFAKRVSGKCVSYGQKGKAKKGGDRIRPGTKKGDAYCARSAKIKKCKNPPCANTLSRKKWKCQGSRSVAEASVFSKEWWLDIINEHILTEGGAAGHMAHPFDLPDVTSGKDLKDLFVKAANSLQSNPGSIKIDGVNSSIRLIDLDGKKQFVMDRGSKKPLDIKGITKDDLGDRFKTKDGSPHGMVKVGGQVLDMFNEALPSLEADLKKLGAWDDPNILFNMEYVSGKTNVQDYDTNFIAIHGLNKVESKEVQGKRGPLIKRASSEVSYDKAALQSMLDNLIPIAEKNGFEVYGSVPTEIKGKPNFGSALSKSYTVKSNEGDKTQSLDKWLSELNIIPKEDFIFIDGIKKGALTKLIYTSLLDGGNIDELFKSEEDKEKAIGGFVTYLATEKLGDEVLKVLDSPMGSAYDHEGVVIRDEKIANVPFKITGKFILGGMYSDF